jgi:hypothetical protein
LFRETGMPSTSPTVQTYVDLAAWYHRHGQASNRDRFLALAADAALGEGRADEADQLHARLLRYNPQHLFKPYATFAEAVKAAEVRGYIASLRRSHPPEEAQRLLATLPDAPAGLEKVGSAAETRTVLLDALESVSAATFGSGNGSKVMYGKRLGEGDGKPAPSRQVAAPRPLLEDLSPAPAPPARSTAAPVPVPRPAQWQKAPTMPKSQAPRTRRDRSAAPKERLAEEGSWVASGLFLLVLGTGVLTAVYTFARPFVPPSLVP